MQWVDVNLATFSGAYTFSRACEVGQGLTLTINNTGVAKTMS